MLTDNFNRQMFNQSQRSKHWKYNKSTQSQQKKKNM